MIFKLFKKYLRKRILNIVIEEFGNLEKQFINIASPPSSPDVLDSIAPSRESLSLCISPDFRIDTALNSEYARPPFHTPKPVEFNLEHSYSAGLLTPTSYDEYEAKGAAGFSLPILMAFSPVSFEKSGIPTRIKEVQEILRYADWNFSEVGQQLFLRGAIYPLICFRNAFTSDEWAMCEGLGQSVAKMTMSRCGQPVRPITALMNAISPLRIVSQLASIHSAPLTLFEVGPGMAYLGPMLAKLGHKYRCMDVTQAFYLWQHHMLSWTTGTTFYEMANQSGLMPIPTDKSVVNLPWWRYVGFLNEEPAPADVVYANACLCEMTPDALRIVLEVSYRMLSQSSLGILFYIGAGNPLQTPVAKLHDTLQSIGFHRVEGVPFTAYVVRKSVEKAVASAFIDGIPFFNPSNRSELYPLDTMIRIPREEAPLDIPYSKWKNGWEPPYLD